MTRFRQQLRAALCTTAVCAGFGPINIFVLFIYRTLWTATIYTSCLAWRMADVERTKKRWPGVIDAAFPDVFTSVPKCAIPPSKPGQLQEGQVKQFFEKVRIF